MFLDHLDHLDLSVSRHRQALGSLGLGHRAHELQDALQVFTVQQLREKQLTREDSRMVDLVGKWTILGDVGDVGDP